MSDTQSTQPIATPPCPLCGGETVLKPVHKAVAAALSVFVCRKCAVEWPVTKPRAKT